MYDHNQTLIPDSFLALHSRHGRPTAERGEVERRYEFAEDLALHVAAAPWMAGVEAGPDGRADQLAALERCRSGLAGPAGGPAALPEAEVGWVVRRVAELMGWDGFDAEG